MIAGITPSLMGSIVSNVSLFHRSFYSSIPDRNNFQATVVLPSLLNQALYLLQSNIKYQCING